MLENTYFGVHNLLDLVTTEVISVGISYTVLLIKKFLLKNIHIICSQICYVKIYFSITHLIMSLSANLFHKY